VAGDEAENRMHGRAVMRSMRSSEVNYGLNKQKIAVVAIGGIIDQG
jgi:hypothetical protein